MNEHFVYEIIFSARKTIAIEIHTDLKVIVRAPKKMSHTYIQKHVDNRLHWIQKKLAYFRTQPVSSFARKYIDGEMHLYLGKQYPLKITASHCNTIQLLPDHFEIVCDNPDNPEKIKKLLNLWYLTRSKVVFETVLIQSFPYFQHLGSTLPKLRVRYMKSQWGSFSHYGVMTLNSDLIRASMPCIEYVVFHELCHIKHKGHGKDFYALLEKVLPDWKQRRQELRYISL